jgi:hypothetical protein
MATAKAKGTRSGKAIGHPQRIFDKSEAVRLRESGWPLQRIANKLGVGLGTISRTIAEQQPTGKAFQKAHS